MNRLSPFLNPTMQRFEIIKSQGWLLLNSVFSEDYLEKFCELAERLAVVESESVRSQAGAVQAARNVLALVPESRTLWRTPIPQMRPSM